MMLTQDEWASAREDVDCVFTAVLVALDDRLLDLDTHGKKLSKDTATEIVDMVYGPLFKSYEGYTEWYKEYDSIRAGDEETEK